MPPTHPGDVARELHAVARSAVIMKIGISGESEGRRMVGAETAPGAKSAQAWWRSTNWQAHAADRRGAIWANRSALSGHQVGGLPVRAATLRRVR